MSLARHTVNSSFTHEKIDSQLNVELLPTFGKYLLNTLLGFLVVTEPDMVRGLFLQNFEASLLILTDVQHAQQLVENQNRFLNRKRPGESSGGDKTVLHGGSKLPSTSEVVKDLVRFLATTPTSLL